MDLNYSELNPSVYQKIRPTRNANIVHIRPHIFKSGSPGGSLKVQLQDEDGFLIAESNSVLISAISDLTYAHGYVKFDINASLKTDVVYRIALVAHSGYVYSVSNHAGFCKDFDLRKVTADYSPNVGFSSAYDIEIWEKTMTDRVIEFFDGFESASAPLAGNVVANQFNVYASDAAFVTAKGSAATEGDIYKSSATGLVRFHNGTEFLNVSDQIISETQATINNNETGPTSVTGLLFDNTKYQSSQVAYTIYRKTSSFEKRETGVLKVQYKPTALTWSIARESDFDNDVGVTLTVNSSGQVQYASDNIAGTGYVGYIRFKTIKTFKPGV